ncbi:hypothetical protein [Aeromonas veronii]|uniref:hypothetical protein n=1 Tax=Aeromonas veronii TaxID=654 RepID=UPI001F0AEB5F|nr:hypothetical protein [Aeromonas veronii]
MQASSMNFGSRLYSLNRQFLLGIKIEDAVETALNDLSNGRKPVIAVENTGESLLRQVISRRAGIEHLEAELTELDERAGALSEEELAATCSCRASTTRCATWCSTSRRSTASCLSPCLTGLASSRFRALRGCAAHQAGERGIPRG